MDASRRRATPEEIEDVVTAIQAYHDQGAASLRLHPTTGYDKGTIAREAGELGWNETKLRKARQFAHEEFGYRKRRLRELFGLLRRNRPRFGIAHIGLLVTVSWDDVREILQERCIERNWSKHTLELEIKSLFPDRRHGGRRRQVGDEYGHLLAQLDDLADSWLRWCAAAQTKQENGRAKRSGLDTLPPDVQQRIREVTTAMNHLIGAIEAPLRRARAKRRREVTKQPGR